MTAICWKGRISRKQVVAVSSTSPVLVNPGIFLRIVSGWEVQEMPLWNSDLTTSPLYPSRTGSLAFLSRVLNMDKRMSGSGCYGIVSLLMLPCHGWARSLDEVFNKNVWIRMR